MMVVVTQTRKHRPTNCIICTKAMPIASRGTVRLTCSDRCRQIKKRYGNWVDWRQALADRKRERQIDKLLRHVERTIGSMDFPYNPANPDLTMRYMVKVTFMRSLILHVEDLTYCGNCGRPYVPKGWRWKYWHMCSDACAKSFAKFAKRVEVNFYANPRRTPEDVMDYLRKRKRLRLCAHCDEPFVPKNKRKYCSDKCKDAAYWKRRPRNRCEGCGEMYRGHWMACGDRCYVRVLKQNGQQCIRCRRRIKAGEEIPPTADTRLPQRFPAGRLAVFCSEGCRDQPEWSRRQHWSAPEGRQCEHCDTEYYPKRTRWQNQQRFCSTQCRHDHRNQQKREAKQAARPKRPCKRCGTMLPDERQRGQFIYCTDRCATEAWREADRRRWAEKRLEALMVPEYVLRWVYEGAVAGD